MSNRYCHNYSYEKDQIIITAYKWIHSLRIFFSTQFDTFFNCISQDFTVTTNGVRIGSVRTIRQSYTDTVADVPTHYRVSKWYDNMSLPYYILYCNLTTPLLIIHNRWIELWTGFSYFVRSRRFQTRFAVGAIDNGDKSYGFRNRSFRFNWFKIKNHKTNWE